MNRSEASRLEALIDTAERLSSRPLLVALRRSLALALPLILTGAFATMLANLPLPGLHDDAASTFGLSWSSLCAALAQGTLGIAALAVLCSFAYVRAIQYNERHPDEPVNPVMAICVALAAYLILENPTSAESWRQIFSLSSGLLPAFLVALCSSELLLRLAGLKELRPPLGHAGHDPTLRDVLGTLPACMISLLIVGLTRVELDAFGIQNLQAGFSRILANLLPVRHDSLSFGLFYSFLSQFLWFFGLHGPNMLFSVEHEVLVPAGAANNAAVLAGLPPTWIFTKQFFDAFTRMGGSGCTLSLIIAVLLKSRNSGSRRLCLLALPPALCNVNEPLIFGIPLMLNPIYALPFVLTPVLQTATAWAATILGLVPHTMAAKMFWTTPALVSGLTATGSDAGAVLQLVNLALGTACYLPFVLLSDRLRERQSRQALKTLLLKAENTEPHAPARKCLDQPGEAGRLAKVLAQDLTLAMPTADQIYFVYQPQVAAGTGRVVGVEALLRWRHPRYGEIPPPVIVALAEDTGRINDLGMMILAAACEQRAAWAGGVPEDMTVAVNVSPRQLEDAQFDIRVRQTLRETGVDPRQLELEITESVSAEGGSKAVDMLQGLRALGVRVAIDDFGMGHTSLRYLRRFPVDTVKLDRSLTFLQPQDVNWHIVHSLVGLSRDLGITPLVEGVERKEQLTTFLELGCQVFQGYYFSRPLSGEACLEYIRET